MKKIIASLVYLFFLSSFAYGQNELVLNNVWEQKLFKKSSEEFFCLHPRSNIEQPGHISTFDGNIDNHGNYSESSWGHINGGFATKDGRPVLFLTFGYTLISYGFIVYDENWNSIIHQYDPGFWKEPRHGTSLGNGNLIIGTTRDIYGLNDDFEISWEINLNGDIADLQITPNDTIVAFTHNGISIVSDSGNLIQEIPTLIFDRALATENQKWVGIKEDSMILLSSSFNPENSIKITNETIIDFESGYGKVILLNNQHEVYVYDNDLTLLNSFTLNGNGLESFSNFELTEDGIIVVGYSTRGTFFKKYGWDGTDLNTENNDIGIIDMDLGEGVVEPYEYIWQGSSGTDLVRITYQKPTFTVKNFGETTITSLTINTYFPVITVGTINYWYHLNGHIIEQINDLSIAPNEEQTVTVNKIEYLLFNNPNGEFYDECFWTSRPNGKVDDNPANDSDCSGFFVGTDEENRISGNVNLYPNPTKKVIWLKQDTPFFDMVRWDLFDYTGRLIFSKIIPPHISTFKIELPELNNGIYFWKAKNEKGNYGSGKLIIKK